jgi:hypothetical protein
VIQVGLSRKIAKWMDAQGPKNNKLFCFQLVRGLVCGVENNIVVGLKSEGKN